MIVFAIGATFPLPVTWEILKFVQGGSASNLPEGKTPSNVNRLPALLTNSAREFVILPCMVTAWPLTICVAKTNNKINSLICIIELDSVASNQRETAIIGRNIGYDIGR